MLEAAASRKQEQAWELRGALERTGSLAYALGVARGRVEQAKAALRTLPASAPRELLEVYANAAVERSY
jgi:geranylgeranyl pyrophosphate synthase